MIFFNIFAKLNKGDRTTLCTAVLLLSQIVCSSQTLDGNYVKTISYLDSLDNSKNISYQFYDGLGRPTLAVSNGVAGSGHYTYNLLSYDLKGRKTKDYYPWSDVSLYTSISASGKHFKEIQYDPLDRITSTNVGGAEWKNKNAEVEYSTNADNEVLLFKTADISNMIFPNAYWPSGSLSVEKMVDEDGHTTRLYKDLSDNIVLEVNDTLKTYYVYDEYGRMKYVLPPSYQYNQSIDDIYIYDYDNHFRCCSKKYPGCAPIIYKYDKNDRIVITCDGLLREKGLYRFYLYDRFGRIAIQGICNSYDEDKLGSDLTMEITSSNNSFENTGYAFSNLNSPSIIQGVNIEIVNFYDNYSYISGWNGCVDTSKYHESRLASKTFAIGALTGQMVATSDGHMLYNTFYYDQKGRVIEERHSTLEGDVYKVITEYSFTDKPTRITKVLPAANSQDYVIETEFEYNEFNDQLKKTTVRHGNATGGEVVSQITYNDLGQIASDSRAGNTDIVNYEYELHGWTKKISSPFFIEQLGYAEAIDDIAPCYNGDISSQVWKTKTYTGDWAERRYGFTYDERDMMTDAVYSERIPGVKGTGDNKYDEHATFNADGGIATMQRYGKTNTTRYNVIDNLTYEYNGSQVVNITDAVKTKLSYKGAFEYRDEHKGSATSSDFAYNSAGMLIRDYDKGIRLISYNNIGLVDHICYTSGDEVSYVYSMTGEKLKVTHFNAVANTVLDRIGFEDPIPVIGPPIFGSGPTEAPTVSTVSASSAPKTVGTNSGTASASSTSSPAGSIVLPTIPVSDTKPTGLFTLQKASETTYIGGDITVDKDGLYSYLFGGGYCEFKPYAAYTDSIRYYYYTKDHLGNVRNVIAKNDNGQMEELQQTHYYPFGGIIADISSGRNVQSRLYNGKEQDFVNNLFWLDYGARQYDPTRGQFTNPDQHCESYYNTNPLTYCHNRPNMMVDPTGMDDYYSYNGKYLYTDDKETDHIMIGGGVVSFEFPDASFEITVEGTPIEETELTAEAYSNIFTTTLKLDGVDTNILNDGRIQVTVWSDGSNQKETSNYTEKASIDGSSIALTDNNHSNGALITAFIWPSGTIEKALLNTRSNIINCLKAHELNGHYINNYKHIKNVPDTIYKNQMDDPSWRKATIEYKNYIKQVIKDNGYGQ